MTKRIIPLLLLTSLLLSCFSLTVAAEELQYGEVPIYTGRTNVDYMADQILKELALDGKSDREKIQAVYDWIIVNCERKDNLVSYWRKFDDIQDQDYHDKLVADLEYGRIVLRQDIVKSCNTYDTTWEYNAAGTIYSYPSIDDSYKITSEAFTMMIDRYGYCDHFAALLTVLLGHLGYDCRRVNGFFVNSDGSKSYHVWNYVLVDDTYYWMDIRIDHASYKRTGNIAHTYFMIEDTASWAKKHLWAPNYPTLLASNAKHIADGYTSTVKETELHFSGWAESSVKDAENAGLIPDVLKTADLTKGITRKDFTLIALSLYEKLSRKTIQFPEQGSRNVEDPFYDIDDVRIITAYQMGIVNGVGEGLFSPNSTLTREQAITMLGRVCELVKTGSITDGSGLKNGKTEIPAFTDKDSISRWAIPYAEYFISHGIVNGVGNNLFAPAREMSREQALKVAVGASTIKK